MGLHEKGMCQNDLLFAVCENNVDLNYFLIKVCIHRNITLRNTRILTL
jgi:hypothetical protein